jgi:hypothetical protein
MEIMVLLKILVLVLVLLMSLKLVGVLIAYVLLFVTTWLIHRKG